MTHEWKQIADGFTRESQFGTYRLDFEIGKIGRTPRPFETIRPKSKIIVTLDGKPVGEAGDARAALDLVDNDMAYRLGLWETT